VEFYRSLKKGKILPNDILIVKDGATTGRVAIVPSHFSSDAAANEHIFVVRTNERRILQQFVFYFLRSEAGQAAIMSDFRGATQGGIGRTFINRVSIPLPSLHEQRWIVSILNRAARIERLRARAQERLREFLPALFVKMFGDPIENPMGWVCEPLGTLVKDGPQNGLYKPKSAYGAGTSILRIDGFYDGRVTDPAKWQRLRIDEATIKKYALLEDDIIINRVNSRPFLGKSAIIPKIVEPAVFESNMMRIRLDAHRILPKFFSSMLQLEPVRQILCANAKDAINQSSINQADVRELLVTVPPLDLQRRYTRIAETVRLMPVVTEDGVSATSELSVSLMDHLLNSGTFSRTQTLSLDHSLETSQDGPISSQLASSS